MGFQCVPQFMGLVWGEGTRLDGKGQAKHRAKAGAIIGEAFLISDPEDGHPIPIRKSASETYDKSRTVNNIYTGYQTADDVIAALEREADAQRVPVQVEDKKTGKMVTHYRPLPSNSVIGATVILNPPCAVACNWTQEQYDKFIQDSLDVLELIQSGGQIDKKTGEVKRGREQCKLFGRANIIATATHWDEGSLELGNGVYTPNTHIVYVPKDEDGKYRGMLIDGIFCAHVSKVYPAMMRERGWDIDDCDCTDWDRYKSDPEYRTQRKKKIKEGGKSVNRHRERETAKNYKESQEILDRTIALQQDMEAEASRRHQQAEAEAEDTIDEGIERAKRIVNDAEQKAAEILSEKQAMEEARDTARADAEAARIAKEKAETDRDTARKEQQEAEQARDAIRQETATIQKNIDMRKTLIRTLQGQINDLNKKQEKAEKEAGPMILAVNRAKKERDAAQQEKDRLQEEINAANEEYESAMDAVKTAKEERDRAVADRDTAQQERNRLQGEINTANEEYGPVMQAVKTAKEERNKAVADRDAAQQERDRLQGEIKTANEEYGPIMQAVKTAKEEAAKLRRTKVAVAEQAAMQASQEMKDKIAANARKAWNDWLEDNKRKAEDKVAEIVAAAVEAVQGDFAPFIKWMADPSRKYTSGPHTGKTWFQVFFGIYQEDVRKQRLSRMPSEVRDAGKNQQAGVERTDPTD